MKKIIIFVSVFIMLISAKAQNNSLKFFWEKVNARYSYNQLSLGMKSWLYSMAEKKTKSYTKALALLENIKSDASFQDEIFLEIYTTNYKSKEQIRLLLGNMCGSFSIGNPVADWVFEKYKKDPRAIQKIKINNELAEKRRDLELANELREKRIQEEENKRVALEERKKEIADSIEKEEIERTGEITPPEFSLGSWNKFIDSTLKYPTNASKSGIGGVVQVQFTVDTLGNVINAKAISEPIGYGLEEEAVRVINLTKWKPAIILKTNKAINMIRKLNIKFNSANDDY